MTDLTPLRLRTIAKRVTDADLRNVLPRLVGEPATDALLGAVNKLTTVTDTRETVRLLKVAERSAYSCSDCVEIVTGKRTPLARQLETLGAMCGDVREDLEPRDRLAQTAGDPDEPYDPEAA